MLPGLETCLAGVGGRPVVDQQVLLVALGGRRVEVAARLRHEEVGHLLRTDTAQGSRAGAAVVRAGHQPQPSSGDRPSGGQPPESDGHIRGGASQPPAPGNPLARHLRDFNRVGVVWDVLVGGPLERILLGVPARSTWREVWCGALLQQTQAGPCTASQPPRRALRQRTQAASIKQMLGAGFLLFLLRLATSFPPIPSSPGHAPLHPGDGVLLGLHSAHVHLTCSVHAEGQHLEEVAQARVLLHRRPRQA